MGLTSFILGLRGIELREKIPSIFAIVANGEEVGQVFSMESDILRPGRLMWLISNPERINHNANGMTFPGKESAASWLVTELRRGK